MWYLCALFVLAKVFFTIFTFIEWLIYELNSLVTGFIHERSHFTTNITDCFVLYLRIRNGVLWLGNSIDSQISFIYNTSLLIKQCSLSNYFIFSKHTLKNVSVVVDLSASAISLSLIKVTFIQKLIEV